MLKIFSKMKEIKEWMNVNNAIEIRDILNFERDRKILNNKS